MADPATVDRHIVGAGMGDEGEGTGGFQQRQTKPWLALGMLSWRHLGASVEASVALVSLTGERWPQSWVMDTPRQLFSGRVLSLQWGMGVRICMAAFHPWRGDTSSKPSCLPPSLPPSLLLRPLNYTYMATVALKC